MTEQLPSFDELKLRIEPGSASGYRVVISSPDGATASGTFEMPFTETELDNFVLRVGQQRRGMRGYRSSHMEEAKRFGTQLFDALMVEEVRDVFRTARGVARHNGSGLRVTLYLTDVPELMEIPWEFLYEQPSFLVHSIYSPVVRALDLGEPRPPRPITLPLHVLGMVSRPRGVEALDIEREREKLTSALKPLCDRQLVTLEWLERATLSQLDEAVSRRDEIHVLHYIGHGAFDTRSDSGILMLETENGDPYEVTGEELGSLVQDEHSLRLVVLNSCEGARSSHLDPFSGVASGLVQYGIPAVIGMQFEITDEAAIVFAARLYTSLAEGFPIDAALVQARKAIFAAGNDVEFGTPVLFLRGGETQLFEFDSTAPSDLWAEIKPDSVGAEPDSLPGEPVAPVSPLTPPALGPPTPSVTAAQPAATTPSPHPPLPPPVRAPLPPPPAPLVGAGKASIPGLSGAMWQRALRKAPRRILVASIVLLILGIIVAAIADDGYTSVNGGEAIGIAMMILGIIGFVLAPALGLLNWWQRRQRFRSR